MFRRAAFDSPLPQDHSDVTHAGLGAHAVAQYVASRVVVLETEGDVALVVAIAAARPLRIRRDDVLVQRNRLRLGTAMPAVIRCAEPTMQDIRRCAGSERLAPRVKPEGDASVILVLDTRIDQMGCRSRCDITRAKSGQ
jgi:hypothetical protein